LAFVAVYDAFFKSGVHLGFTRLGVDYPIFAAHLCLFAGLIVCSALDIEYYLIDLRIVYVILACAFVGWSWGWGYGKDYLWPATGPVFLAVSVGAGVGELVRRIAGRRCRQGGSYDDAEGEARAEELVANGLETEQVSQRADGVGVRHLTFMLLFTAVGVALMVWAAVGSGEGTIYAKRAWGYMLWLFAAIVIGCIPRRESDQEIVEAIEEEKSGARVQALRELLSLLPAVAGGGLALWVFGICPAFGGVFEDLFNLSFVGRQPVAGLTASLAGMIIAVAFGWVVRIGFTLGFGKEAMGVGDIYILAAVGGAAGPLVAVVGFFIGSVIGVFGVVLLLLWKRLRALSYGPWIAIGTLVCVLFYDALVDFLSPAALGIVRLMEGR